MHYIEASSDGCLTHDLLLIQVLYRCLKIPGVKAYRVKAKPQQNESGCVVKRKVYPFVDIKVWYLFVINHSAVVSCKSNKSW